MFMAVARYMGTVNTNKEILEVLLCISVVQNIIMLGGV
jgi:hypothetical protein